MARTPTNAYRVFTDRQGEKQLAYITRDGAVFELEPTESIRGLRDGYYTLKFKLLRLDEKPKGSLRQVR